LFAAGGTLRYVPNARVVHELPAQRLQRRYLVRRLYGQGRSDWLLNRGSYGRMRSAGVRYVLADSVHLLAQVLRGENQQRPTHTFLWSEGARRAGLLREAVAHLPRGRRTG
jgi:hypothetical protein